MADCVTDPAFEAQSGSNGPKMPRLLACATLACLVSGCSTALDLGSNDAGVPYDADCKPGTYTGSFSCVTASTSLIAAASSGHIAVTLVPAGAHTLALEPDASLSLSGANTGPSAIASLSGALDCPTRKLKGLDGPVVFSSAGFHGMVSGSGSFDAIYDADASPPALVDGILNPPPTLGGTCTWTATLE